MPLRSEQVVLFTAPGAVIALSLSGLY